MSSNVVFVELEEFKRDIKKLLKKYPSLDDDLRLRKAVLEVMPAGPTNHTARISDLGVSSKIYKTRLMCRSVKRGDAFRLIYCHDDAESKVTLIELYFKGDKPTEDRKRISRYFR